MACMNSESKPTRWAMMPTLKRCEAMRFTSSAMTRRYSARSGTTTPARFSTAMQ